MIINHQCPLCKTNLALVWSDSPFQKCLGCDLYVRVSAFNQDSLETLYENSWLSPTEEVSETGGTTQELARQYTNFLLHKLEIESFQDKKIIDFGAGRGAMSQALSEAGAEVYAVEPFGRQFLEKSGIRAFSSLDEIPGTSPVDGIVNLDVIEHLSLPWFDMTKLVNRLSPGGWLYTSTPNAASLNARLFGQKWREAHREGHLFLFTAISLRKVLDRTGLANIQRLNWDIHYSNQLLKQIKDRFLGFTQLDGELRFLGYKNSN